MRGAATILRGLLCLGLALALAASSPAQTGGSPKHFTVTFDHDGRLWWRHYNRGEEWKPVPGNRIFELVGPGDDFDLMAVGYADFLHDWVASRSRNSQNTPPSQSINLKGSLVLNLWRVVAAGFALCVGVVALGFWVTRRRHQAALALERAQADLREAAAFSASLFPTDGSLPRKVGRFEVLRPLGQGGMAVVYEVRDPCDGGSYAVKVPMPQFGGDPEFRHRFSREMRLMTQLQHPNVVRIHYAHYPGAPEECWSPATPTGASST